MSISSNLPPLSPVFSSEESSELSTPCNPSIVARSFPCPCATAFSPASSMDASREPSTPPSSISSIAARILPLPQAGAFSPNPSISSSPEPSSPLLFSPPSNRRPPRTPLRPPSATRTLAFTPQPPPSLPGSNSMPGSRRKLLSGPLDLGLCAKKPSSPTPTPPKIPSPFFTRLTEIQNTKKILKGSISFDLGDLIAQGDYAEIYPITGQECLIPSIPNDQILIRLYQKYHLEKGETHITSFLQNQLSHYRELQLVGIPTPPIYNLSTASTDGYFAVARIPHPFPCPKEKLSFKDLDLQKEFAPYREQVRQILATCYAYGIVADTKADNLRIDANKRVLLVDWLEESQELIPFLSSTLHSFAFAGDLSLDPRILSLAALRDKPPIPNLRQAVVDDFLGRKVPRPSSLFSLSAEEIDEPENSSEPRYTGMLRIKKKHIDASEKGTHLSSSFINEVSQLHITSGLGALSLQTLRTLQSFRTLLQAMRNSQELDCLIESLDLLKVYISDTEIRSLKDLFHEFPIEANPEEVKQFANNLVEEIATYLSQRNLSIQEYLAGRA